MELKVEICSGQVVPAEERIKKAIPSKHGLYPHEILVLDYAHTFYINENKFQNFWWDGYGVRDVKAVLLSLLKRGFIKVGDISDTLSSQTAAIVKDVLKTYGIKTSGKKDEIVKRVLDNIPENELDKIFPKRVYALTDSGKTALQDESYVSYIHRNVNSLPFDIWSLNLIMYDGVDMPINDKILAEINKLCAKSLRRKDFGEYKRYKYEMRRFMQKIERFDDTALKTNSELAFFELRGVTVDDYELEYLEYFYDGLFPYKESDAKIEPDTLSLILRCQKELELSDEKLRDLLIKYMSKFNLTTQIFTAEECAQIVFWERDKNIEELTKLYDEAEKKFKQNYALK